MDTNLCSLALAKVIKEKAGKAARDSVKPGKYPVDFVARITGSLNVAEDGKRNVRAEVDYKKAFGLLCDTLVKRYGLDESILEDVIRSIVESTLKFGQVSGATATIIETVEQETTEIVASVDRRGSVTTKLKVELTDPTAYLLEKVA
jgi:hypothetical protein